MERVDLKINQPVYLLKISLSVTLCKILVTKQFVFAPDFLIT